MTINRNLSFLAEGASATGVLAVTNGGTGVTTSTGTSKTVLSSLPSFDTTVGVGAATASASGSGISFPATQSASSNANTLDDYEKGTWTPNQGSGLTVVGTFSSSGQYTKVGRMVTVSFTLNATTSLVLSAAGPLLTNLPFDSGVNTFYYWGTGTNAASSINTSFQTYTTTIFGTTAIGATSSIYGSITYAATS